MNQEHIIDRLGGPTRFAQILGIEGEPGVVQRISNWKRRGIPAKVLLDHGAVIRKHLKTAEAVRAAEPA